MDSTVNAVTAKTGIVDALAARPLAQASPIVADCVAWERSHASTPVMTTGGVRLLPGTTGRSRRADYGTSSFPSSGPSTLRPPV
jgi:hypothetical protein